MRRNQITIKIDRFGIDASNGKQESINIYADGDNVYEALAGAFQEAINKLGNPAASHYIQTETHL